MICSRTGMTEVTTGNVEMMRIQERLGSCGPWAPMEEHQQQSGNTSVLHRAEVMEIWEETS